MGLCIVGMACGGVCLELAVNQVRGTFGVLLKWELPGAL